MEEDGGVVVVPGLGGRGFIAVANAVAVVASARAGDDRMANGKKMIEVPTAENLASHGDLIAEKTTHARKLLHTVRLR